MSRDTRNLSASDIEHFIVSAIEAHTDYQSGPTDDGIVLLWGVLGHVKSVAEARAQGLQDPELPHHEWQAAIDAHNTPEPNAAELAEYARNDIIRREVEIRLREELRNRGLE